MSTVSIRRTAPALLLLLGSVTAIPAPAFASHECRPASFSAEAEATLLSVGVLNGAVFNANLAKAHSEVNSTRKTAASAKAEYADAKLLSASILPQAVAEQSAPPNHNKPDTARLADIHIPGLLKATVGESQAASASARWKQDYACGEKATISQSETAIASAEVLSLLSINSVASSKTSVKTVEVGRNKVGVQATASTGLADITLLNSIRIKVLHQPKLTVTAGKGRGQAVHYDAPMLEVSGLPGGKTKLITAEQPTLDIDLGIPGLKLVKLSLGQVESNIDERKGTVHAQAATLRLQVLKVLGTSVTDVKIGHLSAKVDGKSIDCEEEPTPQKPQPSASPTGGKDEEVPPQGQETSPAPLPITNVSQNTPSALPVTGVAIAGVAVGGVALLLGGLFLMHVMRRRRTTFEA